MSIINYPIVSITSSTKYQRFIAPRVKSFIPRAINMDFVYCKEESLYFILFCIIISFVRCCNILICFVLIVRLTPEEIASLVNSGIIVLSTSEIGGNLDKGNMICFDVFISTKEIRSISGVILEIDESAQDSYNLRVRVTDPMCMYFHL